MRSRFRCFLQSYVCLLLAGCGLFSDPDERVWFGKDPEPLEYQYMNLAGQIQSEKPCFLISPKSLTVGSFAPSGFNAKFLRSSCFDRVAVNSGRSELCEYVISVSTLLYSGDELNRESCRRNANRGNVGTSGEIKEQLLFEEAGITEAEIEDFMLDLEVFLNREELLAFRNQHGERFRSCADRYLIYSGQFFNRIDQLPHFGSDEDLERMKSIEWSPPPRLNTRNVRSCLLRNRPDAGYDHGQIRFLREEGSDPLIHRLDLPP